MNIMSTELIDFFKTRDGTDKKDESKIWNELLEAKNKENEKNQKPPLTLPVSNQLTNKT